MRTTLLVFLLVCGGCSVAPTNDLGDLYAEHAQCLEAGAIGCDRIWDVIERRERAVASRERQRECPSGAAIVGNANGPASCVEHSEVHTMLSRMLR